ncbi:MAG: hypothetical protein E7677_06325 [Ruminococcaceae bacterium]|nr:hypothetical protein [Oscillospiraceae bacterium]
MLAEIEEKEGVLTGKMGALCRGREPIAKADISGRGELCDINGTVSFFYTPLGILVAASVWGLRGGAYSMSITERGGRTREIRTLYGKDGYAWCADLTGRLSARELSESRIELCRIGSDGGSVAGGSVKKCTP